jgi:opacity protein-like surface antigen
MKSQRSRFASRAFTVLASTVVVLTVGSGPASAQVRPLFTVRGFGDLGSMSFTAHDSFDAILGRSRGPIFGGGVEVLERHNLFVDFRASRFSESGERVFRFNGEIFQLGIPVDVTVTPIELTGGYRFDLGWRVVPYGGAGVNWFRYKETSRFATDAENVDETFNGFQILGGAEVRIWKWIAAAGEIQWASVPDALGQDPNGISREFNETDLGGTTIRLKVVIGR